MVYEKCERFLIVCQYDIFFISTKNLVLKQTIPVNVVVVVVFSNAANRDKVDKYTFN